MKWDEALPFVTSNVIVTEEPAQTGVVVTFVTVIDWPNKVPIKNKLTVVGRTNFNLGCYYFYKSNY